ncbi:MAG TPA: hypothetical protein PLS07_04995 [Niabella sp.]|nr:hypothetical protein [Niabella sp.]HQW14546.1 hypothetical protein [Niabella sp.]HQX19687.1 hypothetical protein [Niabella sp.]HQX42821.1 hypothetical protein [Niabella sp.]HRB07576.1 hypothetical protein [Niabella sp.]
MLTYIQTQKIEAWFEENGLKYFDLRQEYVDHLSEAIIQRMKCQLITFEESFDEEVKMFNNKDLNLQNFEAGLGYEPKEEWSYFTVSRVIIILSLYGLFILPGILLNATLLIFVELLYLSAGVMVLFIFFQKYKAANKKPGRKLSVLNMDSLWGWIFPIIYIVFRILYFQGNHVQSISEEKGQMSFYFIVFCLLFFGVAFFARMNYLNDIYRNAKKSYPQLFKFPKYAE